MAGEQPAVARRNVRPAVEVVADVLFETFVITGYEDPRSCTRVNEIAALTVKALREAGHLWDPAS